MHGRRRAEKNPLIAVSFDLWENFWRLYLDAWAERNPLIAGSSDLDTEYELLSNLHHVRIVGKAAYRSPAFGWLREEKQAVLLRLGADDALDPDVMKNVVESFHLIEEEYMGDRLYV